MCESLKYEMSAGRAGRPIHAIPNQPVSILRSDGLRQIVRWLGHIKEECCPPNSPHQEVKVCATEYYESGLPFRLLRDQALAGYMIESDKYPGGKGLFIVTARTEQCRHPKIVNRNDC